MDKIAAVIKFVGARERGADLYELRCDDCGKAFPGRTFYVRQGGAIVGGGCAAKAAGISVGELCDWARNKGFVPQDYTFEAEAAPGVRDRYGS